MRARVPAADQVEGLAPLSVAHLVRVALSKETRGPPALLSAVRCAPLESLDVRHSHVPAAPQLISFVTSPAYVHPSQVVGGLPPSAPYQTSSGPQNMPPAQLQPCALHHASHAFSACGLSCVPSGTQSVHVKLSAPTW
jgi:hypothetical protein